MDRLEELSLVVAICDAGSLAGAARATRRSPAVVTRRLAELERRLGVRLVERTTRRLAVTEAGRILREHARSVLAAYEDAVRAASGERTSPAGTVRVSAPLAFGRKHLAPVVADFLEAHPRMQVELHLSNRIVDLLEERMDVALRIGRLRDARIVAAPVGEVTRVLVASPAYLERRGVPRSPECLERHDLLVQLHGDEVRDWEFGAEPPKAGVVPNARFRVDDAQTAIDAACAGRGIARPLSYQVEELLARGELVRLLPDHEPQPVPVSVVYRDPGFIPLRVRAFVEYASARLRSRLAPSAAA